MTSLPVHRHARSRLSAATAISACVVLTFAIAGCGDGKKTAHGSDNSPISTSRRAATSPIPTLSRAVAPAATAGGLCKKLSYEEIKRQLGLDFSIAALNSSKAGDTAIETCTVRATDRPLPDLALTFAPGKLDAKAFDEQFEPKGSQPVTGLGKDAYSIVRDAQSGSGPVSEVGWFDDNGSYTLVATQPSGASKKTADAAAGRLVALGKKLK